MDLPEDKTMTIDEEIVKTKRLYPNLGQSTVLPSAPPQRELATPNIYQDPDEPKNNNRGAERSIKANDFRLHKINEVQKILDIHAYALVISDKICSFKYEGMSLSVVG